MGSLLAWTDIHASLWWMAALVVAMVEKRSGHIPVQVMILQYMASILASSAVTGCFHSFSKLFARQLHHILNECQRVVGEWCTVADRFQYTNQLSSPTIAASYYAPTMQAVYQFENNVLNLAHVNMELQVHPITYVPLTVTAKRPCTDTGGGGRRKQASACGNPSHPLRVQFDKGTICCVYSYWVLFPTRQK